MRSVALLLVLAIVGSTATCVKRAQQSLVVQANERQSPLPQNASENPRPRLININTASANELETLPGIGKIFAERIIEHRQRYGPFRKAEHLIIVRGISDRRFRGLRNLITVE